MKLHGTLVVFILVGIATLANSRSLEEPKRYLLGKTCAQNMSILSVDIYVSNHLAKYLPSGRAIYVRICAYKSNIFFICALWKATVHFRQGYVYSSVE